jgi:hypothetical protein
MPNTDFREEIAESLRELTAGYVQHVNQCESVLAKLSRQLRLKEPVTLQEQLCGLPARRGIPSPLECPIVDVSTFCVVHGARRCFLGNTLPFWLFALLGQRVNRYISYEDLLTHVWRKTTLSNEAVRNVVQILKKKLVRAGMGDLAGAVDGRNRGHYGLILDRPN